MASKVSHVCALKAQIDELTAELEGLKGELREEARGKLPAGKKRNPAGESVTLEGAAGDCVEVSFQGPKAIAAFWFKDGLAWRFKDSKVVCMGDVERFAGEEFERLFYKQFKPTKKFGEVVRALVKSKGLTKGNGERLLELCLEESTPKVEIKPGATHGHQ